MFSFQAPFHPRLPLLEHPPEPVSMMIDGDSPIRKCEGELHEEFHEEESSIEFEYSMDWRLGQEDEVEVEEEESSIECEYSMDWSFGMAGSGASTSDSSHSPVPPVLAARAVPAVPIFPSALSPPSAPSAPSATKPRRLGPSARKASGEELEAFLAALSAAAAAVPLPDWDDDEDLLMVSPRPRAIPQLPPLPPLPLPSTGHFQQPAQSSPAACEANFEIEEVMEVPTPRPPSTSTLNSARASAQSKKLTPKRFGIRGSPCRKDRRRIWEKPHRDAVVKYLIAVG